MSDSGNFGSDLESDSFGSHLGASDEEVDDECNVNAPRFALNPAEAPIREKCTFSNDYDLYVAVQMC